MKKIIVIISMILYSLFSILFVTPTNTAKAGESWYYEQLSDDGKALYDAYGDAIEKYASLYGDEVDTPDIWNSGIIIPAISKAEFGSILDIYRYDHPEEFQYFECGVAYQVDKLSGKRFLLLRKSTENYNSERMSKFRERLAKFDKKVDKAVAKASDKIRAIGKCVVTAIRYAKTDSGHPDMSLTNTTIECVVNKKGVCAGYNALLSYELKRYGFNAIVVPGYFKHVIGYHCVTLVEDNGEWYSIDPVAAELNLKYIKIKKLKILETSYGSPV